VATSKLILLSPLKGWSAPLDEAPDEVFAGRMLGDGVTVDPTGDTLHSPCDGIIAVLPDSRHAVTVRTDFGAEVLLHVGIDTVALQGEGFRTHVSQGQRVRVGDPLISFEMERLAQRARSLLTPIILTGGVEYSITRRVVGQPIEVGDVLLEVEVTASAPLSGQSAGPVAIRTVRVSFEHGIHARPAAQMARALRKLRADVSIVSNGRTANAGSPTALLSLGIRAGDSINIQAVGADAETAVTDLERLIGGEVSGRSPHALPSGSSPRASPSGSSPRALPSGRSPGEVPLPTDGILTGVVASRGLAVGIAYQLARAEIEVDEQGRGVSQELEALDRARASVRRSLERTVTGTDSAGDIAEAHLALLEDPELGARAAELIRAGRSAGFAWRSVLRDSGAGLRQLADPRMAERAEDLLDLESRVLGALTGLTEVVPVLPPDTIVIANELLPSQLTQLDASHIAGICLAAGGPTSHVAIMAAAIGIPMLVAAGPAVLGIAAGASVILDAQAGQLRFDPPPVILEQTRSQVAARRRQRAAEQEAALRNGHTANGVRIEVFANLGSFAETELAVRNGAEGCGLLRTEFLFLDRRSPPDECEQAAEYQRIATALDGRPLTIRTLDVGGDKPIPYLPLPQEENPALGLRGVRTSLWRPDLLREQLGAILRVRPIQQCRILLPMITDRSEVVAVRQVIEEVRRGQADPAASPALGVMIETPASAVLADRLAREVDFLSVGTNDLTQYTLAMDRGNAQLASQLDGLHPAVLRLIARVAAAGHEHKRGLAVCGGLASDPVAVPILIGLGLHELSMVPSVIPSMKAMIATLDTAECEKLAAVALEQESAEAVRALVTSQMPALATAREAEVTT